MECIMCGDREREKVFSIRRGGVICTQCAGHISDGIRLLPSTLYTLQYIVCSPVEKLYTFVVKEDVLKELKKLTKAYLDEYLGKRQHEKSAEEKEKSLQDSIRKSWYW